MNLTDHGSSAIEKLSYLHTWLLITADAIRRKCDTVECPENEEYLNLNDRLVSEFVVCRVVDIYQIYNRRILKELVVAHPNLLADLSSNLPLKGKEIIGIINGTTCPSSLIDKVQFTDGAVREHIHKKLGFWKEPELDYLIPARNCIVHADGFGFDAQLRERIQKEGTPWNLPLHFSNEGQLILEPQAAYISLDVAIAQISIMDQGCANSYQIASSDRKPKTYSIKWTG